MLETKTIDTTFYKLPLIEVRPLTSDSVKLTFGVPKELKVAYRFVPGQYLTLRSVIDGKRVSRCYSICSSADSGELSVAIRRVKGGLFSSHAVSQFAVNDVVEVMPPMGQFMLSSDRKGSFSDIGTRSTERGTTLVTERCYAAVAGGSGITPILSMITTVMSVEPQSHFVLFYANRSERTMMFRDELKAIQRQCKGRFHLVSIYSDSAETEPLIHHAVASVLEPNTTGLAQTSADIIPPNLKILLQQLPDLMSADSWYLCGPQAMTDRLKQVLAESGVDESRIQRELFTADTRESVLVSPRDEDKSELCSQIKVIFEGLSIEFHLEQEGEVVLNEALKHRDDLPHACQFGACGTCRAKIISGSAVMKENMALEDEEVEEGYVLTCQAQPTSRVLALSFDE